MLPPVRFPTESKALRRVPTDAPHKHGTSLLHQWQDSPKTLPPGLRRTSGNGLNGCKLEEWENREGRGRVAVDGPGKKAQQWR